MLKNNKLTIYFNGNDTYQLATIANYSASQRTSESKVTIFPSTAHSRIEPIARIVATTASSRERAANKRIIIAQGHTPALLTLMHAPTAQLPSALENNNTESMLNSTPHSGNNNTTASTTELLHHTLIARKITNTNHL